MMRVANKWAVVSLLASGVGLCSLLGGAALVDHGFIDRSQAFIVPTLSAICAAVAMLIAAINE